MSAVAFDPDDWRSQAVCTPADGHLFFPIGSADADWIPAKAICARCPAAPECLEWALAHRETEHGCWGGTTPAERRRILRARGVRV